MRTVACFIVLLSLACATPWARAGDWPQFRGPNGSSVSTQAGLPDAWSDSENVAWKTPLPGSGSSSPVVSGDRVFVTCYSGYGVDRSSVGDQEDLKRHLVCVNLADGKILWDKAVPAVLPEDPYSGQLRQHGYASSTPATDGDRVFVFFGKTGVLAFDRDGKQLWQTSVGTGSAIMGWGSAASIVLYKNLVIVNANAESQAIVALDKQTGSEVWRTEAKGYTGSWSTPTLVDVPGGKQELVLFVPEEAWGLDPEDGGLYWYATGVRGTPTSTPVARDGVVYIAAGGPRGAGATAIRAGGSGDVTDTHVLWKQSVGPYVPSPAVLQDHIYWVDDRGIAYCIKAADGQQVYRERLPDGGEAYASVVAADGKLYAVTRRNGTFVLAAGPEFKVLAHNRLESDSTDFNATPAVAGDALLLRSNQALYCIRAQ